MNTIIEEASLLPVEDRLQIVDALLRTINPPDDGIDALWIAEAHRRLNEVRSGVVETIPGDEVFAEIRARFPRK